MLAKPRNTWHERSMLRFIVTFAIALAPPVIALAETLSAEQFERYTRGKTLYFGIIGEGPYGAEEYLDNRRVRWSFLDGQCVEGTWYPIEDQICFLYESDLDVQCWRFAFASGGGLQATFVGDDGSTPLYEITDASEPLYCQGPDIGV